VEDKRFSVEPQQVFHYFNLLFILSPTPSSTYYLETLCRFLLPITSRGTARGKRHGCSRWQNKYFKWKNM